MKKISIKVENDPLHLVKESKQDRLERLKYTSRVATKVIPDKRKYSKKEYFFGPVFLIKKGPLFREYYEREMKSREILLQLLPKSYYLKRYKTKNEIKMIKNEIED